MELWDLAHLEDVVGHMGLTSKAGKFQPELLDKVSASTKKEVETPASGSDLREPSFNFCVLVETSGVGGVRKAQEQIDRGRRSILCVFLVWWYLWNRAPTMQTAMCIYLWCNRVQSNCIDKMCST